MAETYDVIKEARHKQISCRRYSMNHKRKIVVFLHIDSVNCGLFNDT